MSDDRPFFNSEPLPNRPIPVFLQDASDTDIAVGHITPSPTPTLASPITPSPQSPYFVYSSPPLPLPPTPSPPPPTPTPPPPFVPDPRQPSVRLFFQTMSQQEEQHQANLSSSVAATNNRQIPESLLETPLSAQDEHDLLQSTISHMLNNSAAGPIAAAATTSALLNADEPMNAARNNSPPMLLAHEEEIPHPHQGLIDLLQSSLTRSHNSRAAEPMDAATTTDAQLNADEPMDAARNLEASGAYDAETVYGSENNSPSMLLACMEEIQRPAPDLSAVSDLYYKLSQYIECPLCLDLMRPGTRTVGMCYNGHVVCTPCAKKVSAAENKLLTACPHCRSRTFEVECKNTMAINVLSALASCTIYKCEHPNCQVQKTGEEILAHQRICPHRLLKCPKKFCKEKIPYGDYLQRNHTCLVLLEPTYKEPNMAMWQFTVDICSIFSLDNSKDWISEAFYPVLMMPFDPLPNLKGEAFDVMPELLQTKFKQMQGHAAKLVTAKNKMFLTAIEMGGHGGVMFYISSLEPKDEVAKLIQHTSFEISAYIHSPQGKIGSVSAVNPVFSGTVLNSHEQGLYFSREEIVHYIKVMSTSRCQTCSTKDIHFHMTICEPWVLE